MAWSIKLMIQSINLYQKKLLKHNNQPKNFGILKNPTFVFEAFNPLCGDHYKFYIEIHNNCFLNISFTGDGCIISKASASIMTNYIKGIKKNDFRNKILNFKKFLKTGKSDEFKKSDFCVFSDIYKYPPRIKCSILPWETIYNSIK